MCVGEIGMEGGRSIDFKRENMDVPLVEGEDFDAVVCEVRV